MASRLFQKGLRLMKGEKPSKVYAHLQPPGTPAQDIEVFAQEITAPVQNAEDVPQTTATLAQSTEEVTQAIAAPAQGSPAAEIKAPRSMSKSQQRAYKALQQALSDDTLDAADTAPMLAIAARLLAEYWDIGDAMPASRKELLLSLLGKLGTSFKHFRQAPETTQEPSANVF
ncbi:MAG: hypothetical protein KDK04_13310 [Candidatus Competibacteraceae bacterium]|nr:hypothetical protein [Candidatus Competibacteraceae bacterium]MCB1805565.1 hypothetical protein [Candidatus Competibacteraceae bacterium]MCB1812678.1 hypothetical protein [Candidatus Competibacteraceae bacterium]